VAKHPRWQKKGYCKKYFCKENERKKYSDERFSPIKITLF
jgi:hypothetical protein